MKTALRLIMGTALLLAFASMAIAQPCEVMDNGTGTVDLPPDGCGYLAPSDVHEIINGLPPGTTIRLAPTHDRFFNPQTAPGGPLGGELETFDSFLEFQVTGTGDLTGFNRVITVQVQCQTATGPRTLNADVQSFPTEMVQLSGSLVGDPDFASLTITGGTGVGPSPGHTTLTRLGPPGSDFQVDSFFDITYQIDFVGAPGSVLDGLSGSTVDQLHMTTIVAQPSAMTWGLTFLTAVLVGLGVLIVRRRVVA